MTDERRDRGMATRRKVLGDAYVDRAVAATGDFDRPFQDFVTASGWGDIWSRPGLDLKTRSLVTLATVAAIGRQEELAIHVRGALNNGCTPEEIREVFLHTSLYCGVAAGADAIYLAKDIIEGPKT